MGYACIACEGRNTHADQTHHRIEETDRTEALREEAKGEREARREGGRQRRGGLTREREYRKRRAEGVSCGMVNAQVLRRNDILSMEVRFQLMMIL